MTKRTQLLTLGFGTALAITLLAATPVALAQDALIVDHNCIELDLVPDSWIEQAKSNFRLSYGHTSHGSQIVSGMNVIRGASGSLYWWDQDGTNGGLSLWDYTPDGDLGNPDRTTWEARTRTLLGPPENPACDRNCVMWSWCGQAATTEANMQIYLDLMSGLVSDYPNVTFIYMTGHLDGSGLDGSLHLRNEQIRAHVNATGGILFDFADIESYDPDGEVYYYLPLDADDACNYWLDGSQHNWADEWCAANPGECSSTSCAHSRSLNCDMKGRAFWWMMARIAGWPGPDGPTTGDLDCDGDIDFDDIDPFVAALSGQAAYEAAYPDCDWYNADTDHDGDVDFDDIDPFVALLAG